MSTVRNFWSVLRNCRSRFGPEAPASGDHPARAFAGAAQQPPRLDGGPPDLPAPGQTRLCAAGEKMLRTARALGQAPALAVLQIDDLPELELVFGRSAADQVVDAVMTGLTHAAARKGIVIRTAADTFALLMAGGGAAATIAAIQARFGRPCAVEVGVGRDDILVTPDVLVHPVGPRDSIAQVYDDLCRQIANARQQGRRSHDCVPQAPASGSRGMRPSAAAVAQAPAPQYCPPLPATIPVPLGIR